MPSPPLRTNFFDEATPAANELPAAEYNLNATRTDAAYDNAVSAQADASAALSGLTGKQASNANLTSISALVDPDADRILFWDDSAGQWTHLTLGTNLSITGTTINATGGAGGGDASTNTSTSVDSEVAVFSGTAGKTIKRATGTGVAQLTAGVLGTVAPSTSGNVLTSNGATWSSAAPPTGTLPSQTGQSGKYLTTNGTAASWGTVSGDGTVVSGTGTTAIQTAVDAVPDGGVVRIPPGSVHNVTSVTLPNKDITIIAEGAVINTTSASAFAFVQSNRKRLTFIGGTITGVGNGIRYNLSPSDEQSYDFAADHVNFTLPFNKWGINLEGVREATINACWFDECGGIWLVETVNTHITNCQFRNCTIGIYGDGHLTGSSYNAGLMLNNATMLGCGYGVRLECWDWAGIVNSMIDYCDRPISMINITSATIAGCYTSNRDAAGGPYPTIYIGTNTGLPGVDSQHARISASHIVCHNDTPVNPELSVSLHIDGVARISVTDCTLHFWRKAGILVTNYAEGMWVRGNAIAPGPGTLSTPYSIQGGSMTVDLSETWLITENWLEAAVTGATSAVLTNNITT